LANPKPRSECAGCEAAVKLAARSIDGVTDVRASYAKKNAEVTYDPAKTSADAIAKVITEKSRFKAERVQDATKK
jgi:copper chaperone CopZ